MLIPKYFPLTLALLFIAFTSKAQQYKYGLGLRAVSEQSIVGSGVSQKYFFNANSAVEALVSFNPVSIAAMYQYLSPLDAPGLQWYFGGGAFG